MILEYMRHNIMNQFTTFRQRNRKASWLHDTICFFSALQVCMFRFCQHGSWFSVDKNEIVVTFEWLHICGNVRNLNSYICLFSLNTRVMYITVPVLGSTISKITHLLEWSITRNLISILTRKDMLTSFWRAFFHEFLLVILHRFL